MNEAELTVTVCICNASEEGLRSVACWLPNPFYFVNACLGATSGWDACRQKECSFLTDFGEILPIACDRINPSNVELNLICHLLALFGAHHIFHVSGLRDKLS